MKVKHVVVLFGVLALALAACSTGDEQLSLAKHEFPIICGHTASGGEYEAVASLHSVVKRGKTYYLNPNIFCSGTLISSDVVLTAAHCLRGTAASAVAVHFGPNPLTDPDNSFHAVSEVWVHPSYNTSTMENDVAMARLAIPISDITPVPALPASLGFTSADAGMALDFAGFGQDEYGTYNHRLHMVGELGRIESSTKIWYQQPWDGNTQCSAEEGGPCFGDSGGPAFVTRNGRVYVGGMTSYGDSYCEVYGVSSRADTAEAVINAFMGIIPEPDCSANGVCNPDCDAGADPDCTTPDPGCGDGVCAGNGEDCHTCPADCPTNKGACCGDGVCANKKENHTTCPVDCH